MARGALAFLRPPVLKGQNTWDESAHPRGERGQFGSGAGAAKTPDIRHGKLGATFEGRSVVSGDAIRGALPAGTKSWEGIPAGAIREVHFASQEEFKATGLHVLVYKNPPQGGGEAPKRPTYVYSNEHAQKSADAKFAKAAKLAGGGHEKIVAAYKKDMSSKDEHTRACAAVVGLIDATTMRVGGSDSEEDTGSVGATTMRAEHVSWTHPPPTGGGLRFNFPGKSGKEWDRVVTDPKIVKAVGGFLDGKKPGDAVFPVTNAHVNEYLAGKVAGAKVTAKDFRTYHATAMADRLLKTAPDPASEKEAKEVIKAAVEQTSGHLGNTPAVCRDKYIDPRVIDRYLSRLGDKGSRAEKAMTTPDERAAVQRSEDMQREMTVAVEAYGHAMVTDYALGGADVVTPDAAMLDDE